MTSPSAAAGTAADRTAPVLLRNVRLGCGGPLAHILVAGGRIAAVTPDAPAVPAGGESVDAGGRTVLPGLWDAHVHMVQWASARRRVDLSATASAAAAAAVMAEAARGGQHPADEPLIGFGFRDGLWPDHPEPALLAWSDAGGRPVALVSNDLHTAWLNGAALHALGAGGHPTGVLREAECLDAVARLTAADPPAVDRWVAGAVQAAAARGVVGLLDFEYADNIGDWTRRAAHAPLGVRVQCTIYPAHLDEAIARGLRTGDTLPDTGGLVRVGPLKLFVDGSLNTRTALCNEPYPGVAAAGGQEYGILQTAPAELERLMAYAARHGIHTAVHAIGDRANTIALDAFERTGGAGRIEHAQLIDRADLPRFARPGLVLGVQPAHAADDRDIADRHWAGRTDRSFAYADLARAGARLEIGSDAPVAPLDPWLGIAAAVYRTADGRPGWHPEQAIALPDALAAAAAGRRTLRVGDRADLVVTEQDPARATPRELASTAVFCTMLAGRFTHRAPGAV